MTENESIEGFACTLPPPELRRRRVEVISGVRRRVEKIEETPLGFVLTFPKVDGLREELEEFIRFEAACCNFIDMQVTETASTFELRMHGIRGAKPFIEAEFIDVPVGDVSCDCAKAKEVKP